MDGRLGSRSAATIIALVAVLTLGACGESGDATLPPASPGPTESGSLGAGGDPGGCRITQAEASFEVDDTGPDMLTVSWDYEGCGDETACAMNAGGAIFIYLDKGDEPCSFSDREVTASGDFTVVVSAGDVTATLMCRQTGGTCTRAD